MPMYASDLLGLDIDFSGEMFFSASLSIPDTGLLDIDRAGEMFYATGGQAVYNPEIAASFTIEAAFSGALSTAIPLAGAFNPSLDMVLLYMNSGPTNKMELIF